MTIRSAGQRHLSLRIKKPIKSRLRRSRQTISHRWFLAKAGLRPGYTIALVASLAEASRLPSHLHRITNTARAKGCVVELYILDFDLETTVPERSEGDIQTLWIDAARPANGGPTDDGVSIPSDLSEAPYPLPNGEWATGYYKNGQPTLLVTHHPGGTRLEHLGAGGRSMRRDEFDLRGRLVRRIDMHPATGKTAVHRYVDSLGRTWLSMQIDAEGNVGPAWQFHPQVRGYDSLADMQVAWLGDHLRRTKYALVLAAGNTSRPILQRARE